MEILFPFSKNQSCEATVAFLFTPVLLW